MAKPAGRSGLRRLAVRRRLLVERLGDRRVLAAITGAVFEDLNFSLQREAGEAHAPARLVYIDANRNERLDSGESLAMSESNGSFRFEGLADGNYLLRLFNGTASQVQTMPVEASVDGSVLSVQEAIQFQAYGGGYVAITPQSIVRGDLERGETQVTNLGGQLAKMQQLPDGRLLLVGSDDAGAASWVVDPFVPAPSTVELDAPGLAASWADVALDASGRGLLLEASDAPFALRAVEASASGGEIEVTTTSTIVPADTQVLTSDSGNRSVLAWGGDDGLQVSLWSNVTASLISPSARDAHGATELLAFDDASGLLVVRVAGGGVRVHDVDGNFSPLHTLEGVSGPVAIDGSRELLITVSPDDAMLKVFNLRDGEWIAEFAVDLEAVGPVQSLSLADAQSIGILGAAGIAEIALRRPAAHEVNIVGGQDADPILFGIAYQGSNSAPRFTAWPAYSIVEDMPISRPGSELLRSTADDDGDQYVVVQTVGASNGTSRVEVDGAVTFSPNQDYYGDDSIVVLLFDGRDVSPETRLLFSVESRPDSPTAILVDIEPFAEDITPGTVIGTYQVLDPDGSDNLLIDLGDPRFGVQGNQILYLRGSLDFESEPGIQMSIVATDPETGEGIEKDVTLEVDDRNDPILGISPDTATVLENDMGGFVAFIGVDDGDDNQTHILTVDDERFYFLGRELRLVPGVSLDYEREPVVVVQVTATEDIPNGNSLTEPITIKVGNVPEQPQSVRLDGDMILEMVPGHIVGNVSVDGRVPDARFELSVDDPRFEIVDHTLKLLDGVFVEHASQSEVEVEITASDTQGEFAAISGLFVIRVRENETPYHNHENPYDVDHSGEVTALDALAIINYLNTYGPGPVRPTDTGYCYDVNADAMVTAIDVLLVLNELNRVEPADDKVGQDEGDQDQPDQAIPAVADPPVSSSNSLRATAPASRNEDEVFGQWESEQPNSSVAPRATSTRPQSRLAPRDDQTLDRSFTNNVDATIRLLSDKQG